MTAATEPHHSQDGGPIHHIKSGAAGTDQASALTPKQQQTSVPDIIDISRGTAEINLKEEILSMFSPKQGPRQLPTLLLYDVRGLQLFEDITYLDEYYLTNDEIEVLQSASAEIASQIPDDCMVIELGSGNLRKVNLLLQALEATGKKIDYYALDLSQDELERTLSQLPQYRNVRCHGLRGTYDDGREWLKLPSNLDRKKCILTLGSSIGNFHRHDASQFLRGFADMLCPGDKLLVGLDACDDPARVYHGYNDREGLTHKFVMNGLVHANEILGEEAFHIPDWDVIGEYIYDAEGGRHQAFFSPVRDTVVMGETIKAHERIQIEQSLKFSKAESETLWDAAGMVETAQWTVANEYGLHLLTRPDLPFSLISNVFAKSTLPALQDWRGLWKAWDAVTLHMLPGQELHAKPIKLRNACIFYLGHIPTFLDIQLTKTTKESPTEPRHYSSIFERGIDPDVDNPELCHDHSDIPDEWPPVEEILQYQHRVRQRVLELYSRGTSNLSRFVCRSIWIGFEHEVMHLETLLYMMLQSDKILPPPIAQKPDFAKLAAQAASVAIPNEWFSVPARDIDIGLDDPEDSEDPSRYFGWDNEKPPRKASVHAFEAKGRPITNEEYAQYMVDKNIQNIPTSWAKLGTTNGTNGKVNGDGTNGHSNGYTNGYGNGHSNGHANGHSNGRSNGAHKLLASFIEGKAVRTVYGLVPLKDALFWPIFASYDELAGCALWMGGRIPTFEEARSIYAHVDVLKKERAEGNLTCKVPAVNGHLSNDGVEETPPARGSGSVDEEASLVENFFIDLDGTNVGFQHWHPMPVTGNGNRLAGQGEMGGVWEWTSSTLRKYEGFEPMSLYPGYTADFFDEKHNIVLGGSWATHPRIAGRKSFVNWYQRNYLYAWVGARIVRDIPTSS